MVLVDVRQPKELLTDGEIRGSVNVPLQVSSSPICIVIAIIIIITIIIIMTIRNLKCHKPPKKIQEIPAAFQMSSEDFKAK